ncbi:hypothetical protein [Thermogymnomonas acidicola]|uniref:hypothetical protein n=1 Tax=Thermogymnomonas acidicola TaxID=399579 RepID=UPI00094653CD|nr:hypothetical protein [Thermogymnomonas acidicola]
MGQVRSLLYGIFPRSEQLRLTYGRWERGSVGTDEVKERIREEKEKFYGMCRNIDLVTDPPLFNWHDILRPLALATDGITLGGPLTRYLETNTFYREPLVSKVGKLRFDPYSDAEVEENPPMPIYMPRDSGWATFLPSPPLTFVKLSRLHGISEGDAVKGLVDIYRQVQGGKSGTKNMVLFEALPYGKDDLTVLDPLFRDYKVTLVVQGRFSEKPFQGLHNRPDTLVVDLSDIEAASRVCRNVGVKALDAHNTRLEGKDAMRNLEDTASTLSGDLYVTTNDYLDFLPRGIAEKKVAIMEAI